MSRTVRRDVWLQQGGRTWGDTSGSGTPGAAGTTLSTIQEVAQLIEGGHSFPEISRDRNGMERLAPGLWDASGPWRRSPLLGFGSAARRSAIRAVRHHLRDAVERRDGLGG